jgi:hypothetical protein
MPPEAALYQPTNGFPVLAGGVGKVTKDPPTEVALDGVSDDPPLELKVTL